MRPKTNALFVVLAVAAIAGCGGTDDAKAPTVGGEFGGAHGQAETTTTEERPTTTAAPRLSARDEQALEGLAIDVSERSCVASIEALEDGLGSIGYRQLVSLASCPSPSSWEAAIRRVKPGSFASITVNIAGVNRNLCRSANGWGILPGCPMTADFTYESDTSLS